MEPVLGEYDLQRRVNRQAQVAWVLAQFELAPPGYDRRSWAGFLFDIPWDKLRVRALKKVAPRNLNEEGFLWRTDGEGLPEEMAPKMRSTYMQLLRELVARKVWEALHPSGESANALDRATAMHLAQAVLQDFRKRGIVIPKMTIDLGVIGEIQVRV